MVMGETSLASGFTRTCTAPERRVRPSMKELECSNESACSDIEIRRVRRTHSNVLQHSNATQDIARVKRVVETRHRIATRIRDLLHLDQLVRAASGKVQER